MDELTATLLVNRRYTEPEDVRAFLTPRLSSLPDPSLMAGMDRAVSRILAALDAEEVICVWGDYDVDGVTSASQLLAFFEAIGSPARGFVPDRFRDGYGLNGDRIAELAEQGVQLLITVDCGISNAAEIEVAASLGVDVIVVDHHQVPEHLPKAAAVLDPHQPGCTWPEKDLAACGVAWVLLVALRRALRDRGGFEDRREPDLREWLDLTAIGTVADMVPLRGLNRVIVSLGLQQIGQSRRPGVRALCEVSGLKRDGMTAGRIGFHLGPRINAAGRVAHAGAGIDLLTTSDARAARTTAREIDAHNLERRGLQESVFLDACRLADAHPAPETRRAIVLAQPGWHPGVLGIVASKIVDRYHRPTVILTIEDGVAKGSARSIRGFKLVEHLTALETHLTKYGGHDHAAGMTLPADAIEIFAEALDARARDALQAEHLMPRLSLDAEWPLGQVSFLLIEDLERLAPHGMGNPEPVLYATGVRVLDQRTVGKDKRHL
ncbi:MAG: single-stranded-DNA-specific exonuclease RecJ, partial [Myxococcota bacterium]|nr:single-stranded-DNA-specific exonuclease RecJ [Myxococcota bacterium]